MRWRPHTERPDTLERMLVAVRDPDGRPFILAELYRYDAEDGLWFGVTNYLMLKFDAFHWLPEAELLQTLPPGCP